jgi:hypothetical protein
MPNYHKTDATLFKNGYKTMEKHPDLNGTVKVTDDILRTLMAQRKAGGEPIIKLAGWNRTAKETGQPYIYLSVEAVEEDQTQAAPEPAPAPAPAPAPQASPQDGGIPWE